jgi:hypothetical protein
MASKTLAEAERSTFRAAADTGLWDLFVASVVAMFAIAPLLSVRLGDFWSSAVFLPIWAVVYLALRSVKERIVVPRVGVVEFGTYRKRRLRSLSLILLVVNLVAFAVGILAATSTTPAPWAPIFFSLVVLAGFSLAAHFLSIPRIVLYGLMLAAAPLAGEWLFRQGHASHHGYPIVFGLAAVVIAATGLIRFRRRVLSHRPAGDAHSEGTDDA